MEFIVAWVGNIILILCVIFTAKEQKKLKSTPSCLTLDTLGKIVGVQFQSVSSTLAPGPEYFISRIKVIDLHLEWIYYIQKKNIGLFFTMGFIWEWEIEMKESSWKKYFFCMNKEFSISEEHEKKDRTWNGQSGLRVLNF